MSVGTIKPKQTKTVKQNRCKESYRSIPEHVWLVTTRGEQKGDWPMMKSKLGFPDTIFPEALRHCVVWSKRRNQAKENRHKHSQKPGDVLPLRQSSADVYDFRHECQPDPFHFLINWKWDYKQRLTIQSPRHCPAPQRQIGLHMLLFET